jgi:hypothetical protein
MPASAFPATVCDVAVVIGVVGVGGECLRLFLRGKVCSITTGAALARLDFHDFLRLVLSANI